MSNIHPLVHADAELIAAASETAELAYCPYSRFRVGAAVLADGRIFRGCNIENASLGLTICAERVAMSSAVAAGCKHFEVIAIACPDAEPTSMLSQSHAVWCLSTGDGGVRR